MIVGIGQAFELQRPLFAWSARAVPSSQTSFKIKKIATTGFVLVYTFALLILVFYKNSKQTGIFLYEVSNLTSWHAVGCHLRIVDQHRASISSRFVRQPFSVCELPHGDGVGFAKCHLECTADRIVSDELG
jgi:hypothetical protein